MSKLADLIKPTQHDVSINTVMDAALEMSVITALMNNDIQTIQTLITAENVNHYMLFD